MKNKHLTIEERDQIYEGLKRGMNFKEIGKWTGKDPSTISKEIKKHLTIKPSSVKRFETNGEPSTVSPCQLLLKPPYCCNSCKKRYSECGHDKCYYEPRKAHSQYRETLVESREGIALSRQDFWDTDRLITKGISNGQHLYQIVASNEIPYSQSSVYRLLKEGKLSCSPIDFPRVVKFRPRKKKYLPFVPPALKAGKTYDDFTLYIENNDVSSWVEMDTVIGTVGGKCIMTFDFTFCNFMFGILLDDKTADSASSAIRSIKVKFSEHNIRFGDIFPLIITDNGGEFSDIAAFESDINGEKETELFFCDPYKSSQKPKVEKNHTMFRDIVPSGTSFNNFTQNMVNMIFSHVNSVARKKLLGKTPYEMFEFTFGKEITDLLGITKIEAAHVIETPLLLDMLLKK